MSEESDYMTNMTDDERVDYVAGAASGCSDFGGDRDEWHAEIVELFRTLRERAWQEGFTVAWNAHPDIDPTDDSLLNPYHPDPEQA